MKKILTFVFGLMFFSAAQACNWDRQDCSDEILGKAIPKLNWLKQQPGFNEKHGQEIQDVARQTDINARTCNSPRGCNTIYNNFAGRIDLYYYQYQRQAKAAQQPATQADKWSDQCVIAKSPKVFAYTDMSCNAKVGDVSEYIGYKVTKTSGEFVGLTNSQNGKFTGWAKKAELQMQDMRNCNM